MRTRFTILILLLATAAWARDEVFREVWNLPQRSNTMILGRTNIPWKEIHGGRFFRYGEELTNSAGGSTITNYIPNWNTNVGWVVLTSIYHTTWYYPVVDDVTTNGVVLHYNVPGGTPLGTIFKLEYVGSWIRTNGGNMDGVFSTGLVWTDLGGLEWGRLLVGSPLGNTMSEGGLINAIHENFHDRSLWGGMYYLHAKAGTSIQVTNQVVHSWDSAEPDAHGMWHWNGILSTLKTNIVGVNP